MSTALQERYFAFIRDHVDRLGFSPTYEELADHFGATTGTASSVVQALIGQKRLAKTKARTRNLTIGGTIDLSSVGTTMLQAELARRGITLGALDEPRLRYNQGQPCAANHCANHVRRGHLMCRDHWWKLEPQMRSAILDAFSARDTQAYGDAVEAARNFLGGYTRVLERAE